ncbi:MAG: intradiol ring-cleavage dioxygenase [Rhodoferax sp.]|nr:intradiol ring-cleavage dioxygenase [Rhodoferax sp.]
MQAQPLPDTHSGATRPPPLHGKGLSDDLQTLIATAPDRRQVLRWLGLGAANSLALWGLAACGGGGSDSSTASTTTAATTTTSTGTTAATTTTATTGTCVAEIPSETAGPYPGDGSNSSNGSVANALLLSGIVRSDIRASIVGSASTAPGLPLTVTLTLVNASGCAALTGYAVYLWHCTRDGEYSMYGAGITNENYLRGVQVSDANGQVQFTTIFPGCYSGRMTHIHFEVYKTLATATSNPAGDQAKTSQFTFPLVTLNEAYATSGYSASVRNLAAIGYASDNVFSDGTSLQMAAVTGSASAGYAATLSVGVAA